MTRNILHSRAAAGPANWTPEGIAAWRSAYDAWCAAWGRRYARESNRPIPRFQKSRLLQRHRNRTLAAVRAEAERLLPPGVRVAVQYGDRRIVAWLGGPLCVIELTDGIGPIAAAAWVREEIIGTRLPDRGLRQSLAYLTGPYAPGR